MSRPVTVGLSALGVALALGAFVHLQSAPSSAEAGTSPSPRAEHTIRGGAFSLVDHRGRAVTDRDFRGRFMLIYFGYTHCPDVCPAGVQVLNDAMYALGPAAEDVQPIFITFDPERDSVERLAEFAAHFHPRLLALTGTEEQTLAAANAYGVNVSATYAANQPGLDYSMNHSSFTYLVGPDGRLRLMFRDGIGPDAMASSIRRQLEGPAPAHADGHTPDPGAPGDSQ